MNQVFANNLAAIRIKSPRSAAFLETYSINEAVEISFNNQGRPFCKRRGIALHSMYDPEKEALLNCELFRSKNPPVSTAPLYVLGSGLFYHIRQLIQFYSEIVIYEADTDLLYAVLNNCDLVDILNRCRLILPVNLKVEIEELQQSAVVHDSAIQVYRHQPSFKIFEPEYHLFLSSLQSSAGSAEGVCLKILLAGPLYGGSLPVYHYCYSALTELGHQVIGLDFSIHRPAMEFFDQAAQLPANRQKMMTSFARNLADSIVVSAIENEVDLVLGIAQAPFTADALLELKKRGIVTAFWFVEDFRTLLYWQNYAALYDYFFVIQKEPFFAKLKKTGCKNYHYLPMAADPAVHKKVSLSDNDLQRYASQVSFVGAGYYNRRRAFLALLNYDFKIWGNDWQLHSALAGLVQENGRRVTTEETVKIFNASQINLNLHSSSYVEDVNPDGDFVNPRTLEIAASQNFQLVDSRSLLSDLFLEDEIATYSSLDEMKTKISYYLDNPIEREKVIQKSYLRTISSHTYKHRMQELVNVIVAGNAKLAAKRSWKGNRDQLIRQAEAAGQKELSALLSEITDDQITLETVIRHLKEKKQPLDRTGGLFLMMHEFWNFAKRKNLV